MAYEDFTTYTEFDEDTKLVVTSATKVSYTNLPSRSKKAYLYKDKGAGHFSGDLTHKFEVYTSLFDGASYLHNWMLANAIGDAKQLLDANADYQGFFTYDRLLPTESRFYIRIIENGSEEGTDNWASVLVDTLYFIEVVRDDDGGANSTGRLTAYIRTGSHSGVLQDTLVVDCSAGEQNDFRYLYSVSTYDDNSQAKVITGYTQNLDIGEGATYDESSRLVTITSTVSETDAQAWVDTELSVGLTATLGETDLQAYADTGLSVSLSLAVSAVDFRQLFELQLPVVVLVTVDSSDLMGIAELGLSVNLALAVSETDLQAYQDSLTIPLSLAPSVSEAQDYIETTLTVLLTLAVSVFDSVPYSEIDLLIDIVLTVSETDIRGYPSEDLLISLIMSVTPQIILEELVTIPLTMNVSEISGYPVETSRQLLEIISREKSFELIGRTKTYYLYNN